MARYAVPILVVLAATSVVTLAERDEIAAAWLARADRAAKRLAEPGLDACDVAYERAFQRPKENARPPFRVFELAVEISGRTLRASYSYRVGKVASFELISLPPGWIARQRVNSKTLSILVAAANCGMDFCTSDPLVAGPCPGDTPE